MKQSRNINTYLLIVFITVFLALNLFLYSNILGTSFLLCFFLVILCTGIGFLLFYFIRYYHQRRLRPAGHFIVRQESALNREAGIQNMQSQAVKIIDKTNFLLHKRIILVELIIILLLFVLLIVRM